MIVRKSISASIIALVTALAACESPYYAQYSPAMEAMETIAAQPQPGSAYWEEGREAYPDFEDNPWRQTALEPVSTFSVDVDTASYARVRRFLNDGQMPPRDAVRSEELVNYFRYGYPLPADRETPFRADIALFDAPWDEDTQLLRIGIQGFDIPAEQRPPANLVFLIDTSGSMSAPDKLPLVQKSLRMLAREMGEADRIALVAYAGSAGVVLPPTEGRDRMKILAAIDNLSAGGSTAGGAGIELAYRLAGENFRDGAVNRVILATDGDFNVGIHDPESLRELIASKRRSGVYLSVLGYGTGNLQDSTMQALAQAGNGNAAYIDSFREARKVLSDEIGGTLFPIADDVKLQIEFNPAYVAEYRLIGYETRLLRREDFNDDSVDAGEIGSGHSVTALYEVIAPDSSSRRLDPLRYGDTAPVSKGLANGELAWLRIRYKLPGAAHSGVVAQPVRADARTGFAEAPDDARFAAAVAGFGQLLRGRGLGEFSYDDVLDIARDARGEDSLGYRAEFVQLVRMAGGLSRMAAR